VVDAVLERIPAGKRCYLSIDIDGFDPSIAPPSCYAWPKAGRLRSGKT
jgi:arginase family enzyme